MRPITVRSTTTTCLALALMAGCSGSTSDSPKASGPSDNAGVPSAGGRAPGPMSTSPGGSATGPGGGAGGAAGMPALPPETEERRTFEAPRAGARFVYVANTKRDTVSVIDSTTLAIRSVDTGDAPTTLTTVPGKDLAVVLDLGSSDATILRTDANGATRTTTVPTARGVNAVSVAPDGLHAIAWNDSRPGAAVSGAAEFQSISVITFGDPDRAVPMTVGFRPSDIAFASDGSAAFVVTEDGISIVRFADATTPRVAPFVPLAAGATKAARDVSVTPDGKFALARHEGESEVQLVDLATRAVTRLDLKTPVTDLDLSPDGKFALAVLRDTATVVQIPLPAGFTDAAQRRSIKLAGETVGSADITPDGKTAVLYTTAAKIERLIVLPLDGQGAPVGVPLKKGVRAVALSPDSRTALVVHTKEAGDPRAAGIDVEAMIDRSDAYSVVDLGSGFPKLQLTAAPVGDLAITPDSARAFVLLRDDKQGIRVAQRIDLASFLVTDFPLGSPPVSIAVLGDAKRIFVSQEHPEGRISFIQWETGAVESVTGFELNGRIVQ